MQQDKIDKKNNNPIHTGESEMQNLKKFIKKKEQQNKFLKKLLKDIKSYKE